MLPNFLIVGVAKSGTTSLYHYLKQHPQIFMSSIKEPYFFSFIDQKPNFNGPFDGATNEIIITDLKNYEELFRNVNSEKAIGECSNSYLYFPQSAKNIKKYIPNCKIIIILRNPVDRAYSHYMQSKMIGHENLSFKEAISKEKERLRLNWRWHYQYTSESMYYEQVKRYLELFGKEKVKVYLFDELKNNPFDLIKDIYKFLNVNSNFKPSVDKVYNPSGIVRIRLLQNLAIHENEIKTIFKKIIPTKIRPILKNFIRSANIKKYSMPIDVREYLEDLFTKDIIKTEQLIERDLSIWRR